MLHLIAIALVSGQSLYSTIVPRPTGTNGYEDYLRAVDLLDTEELDRYDSRLGRPAQEVDSKDTNLDVRKKLVSRFQPCLEALRIGNEKMVWDPRPPDFAGKREEVPKLMRLGEVAATAAYVNFANGRPADATEELIQGMTYSRKIAGPPLIWMCGQLMFSRFLAEINEQLPAISLYDAQRLRDFAADLLSAPSPARTMLVQQAKETAARLASALDTSQQLVDPNDPRVRDSERALVVSMAALSPAGREEAKNTIVTMVGDQLRTSVAILDGPETGLFAKSSSPAPDASIPGQIANLAGLNTMGLSTIRTEGRWRTDLRLLLLEAKAAEYRWQNGSLPDRIEQFSTESERFDPKTGAPFVYKREANWFQITRKNGEALPELTPTKGSWWQTNWSAAPTQP